MMLRDVAGPDFGEFGGRFMPESLIAALDDKPPHDKLELQQTIHDKLQQLKAFSMPLPPDLVELEAILSEEIAREHPRTE